MQAKAEVTDVGCFRPQPVDVGELDCGEVGFVAGALKDVRDVRVGDTITTAERGATEPLPGYRGVYENPCGSILFYAHTELERLCLDRATFHFKEIAAVKYSELVYDGMWFAPLREALQAFADKTSETVTGKVTLRLYKGNIMSNGAESPYSLYNEEFVTFGEDDVYNQADAEGFINLFGLPLTIRGLNEMEHAGFTSAVIRGLKAGLSSK